MANPFLIVGGIAVGIVTAAFGILQVPGWVAQAQDGAANNDLAGIRAMQAVALSDPTVGSYFGDVETLLSGVAGTQFKPSGGTEVAYLDANDDAWCAAVKSASGVFLATTSKGTSVVKGATYGEAAGRAGCFEQDSSKYTDWVEQRRNLAVNPTGGFWKAAWSPQFGFANDRWGARGTYSFEGDWARFTRNTQPNTSHGFHLTGNPEGGATSSYMAQVVPGSTYTISADVRLSSGTGDGIIRWRFADESNNWLAAGTGAKSTPISATATTVDGTFTVPAGASRVAVFLVSPHVPELGYIEATKLMVELSATRGTYIDGSRSVSDPEFTRLRWLGAPGASESVLESRTRLP